MMTKHDAMRRLNLRRSGRRRGAAMVEALVVIPFFMLILAGAMFVGGFFGKRIDSQSKARFETWKRAVTENCDSKEGVDLEELTVVDSSDLGELSKSPLAALCDKDFGSVRYEARASHEVTGPFPFPSKEIRATAMAPCNESPIPGDVAYQASVEFLWDAYQNVGTIPPDADPPTVYPMFDVFGDWGYAPLMY